MLGKPGKLTVLVLISMLLLTGLGSAYGFVICDQGCFSAAHHASHHKGEKSEDPSTLPFYPLPDSSEDTCHDYQLQLCDCDLEEKPFFDLKMPMPQFGVHPVFGFNLHEVECLTENSFTTTQTLLVHRTIVLLI